MQPAEMAEVVRPYATVSDKIRALDQAGVARADIARFLNKRYQHVRNVLVADGPRHASSAPSESARLDPNAVGAGGRRQAEDDGSPAQSGFFRLVVSETGDLALPRAALNGLGVGPGDVLIGRLTEDEFSLVSGDVALRRAQALVRGLVAPNISMAGELIDDRRRQAGRDEDGD